MSVETQRPEHAFGPPTGAGLIALRAAGAVLLVFLGYVLGSGRSTTHDVTAPVQVGDHVVTMMADGTAYGFAESIPWVAVDGSHHEGGWPDCLGTRGEVTATFGVASVTYPDGASGDQVVYVDCSR